MINIIKSLNFSKYFDRSPILETPTSTSNIATKSIMVQNFDSQRWLSIYRQNNASSEDYQKIFVEIYDNFGNKLIKAIKVNPDQSGDVLSPVISPITIETFAVSWINQNQVFAQIFNINGTKIYHNIVVRQNFYSCTNIIAISPFCNGTFSIFWDERIELKYCNIFQQSYNSQGIKLWDSQRATHSISNSEGYVYASFSGDCVTTISYVEDDGIRGSNYKINIHVQIYKPSQNISLYNISPILSLGGRFASFPLQINQQDSIYFFENLDKEGSWQIFAKIYSKNDYQILQISPSTYGVHNINPAAEILDNGDIIIAYRQYSSDFDINSDRLFTRLLYKSNKTLSAPSQIGNQITKEIFSIYNYDGPSIIKLNNDQMMLAYKCLINDQYTKCIDRINEQGQKISFLSPTSSPTTSPTAIPTNSPTFVPTYTPTSKPTNDPSSKPTIIPTFVPTNIPSAIPTNSPTFVPTLSPSAIPTNSPTNKPTYTPTSRPTNFPSFAPTKIPSSDPSYLPTNDPSSKPTIIPTFVPTNILSAIPTNSPIFVDPSNQPTALPPSPIPTKYPADDNNLEPTGYPTDQNHLNDTHLMSDSFKQNTSNNYWNFFVIGGAIVGGLLIATGIYYFWYYNKKNASNTEENKNARSSLDAGKSSVVVVAETKQEINPGDASNNGGDTPMTMDSSAISVLFSRSQELPQGHLPHSQQDQASTRSSHSFVLEGKIPQEINNPGGGDNTPITTADSSTIIIFSESKESQGNLPHSSQEDQAFTSPSNPFVLERPTLQGMNNLGGGDAASILVDMAFFNWHHEPQAAKDGYLSTRSSHSKENLNTNGNFAITLEPDTKFEL